MQRNKVPRAEPTAEDLHAKKIEPPILNVFVGKFFIDKNQARSQPKYGLFFVFLRHEPRTVKSFFGRGENSRNRGAEFFVAGKFKSTSRKKR